MRRDAGGRARDARRPLRRPNCTACDTIAGFTLSLRRTKLRIYGRKHENWVEISRRYRTYIRLEKRLADNTVESYMRDLSQFAHFVLLFYDARARRRRGRHDRALLAWLLAIRN